MACAVIFRSDQASTQFFGFVYFGAHMNDDNTTIDILSSDRETDLFNYSPQDESTLFLLKLNGFANIEKITAPKSNVEFGDSDYAYAQWSSGAEIHITNGNVIKETDRHYADGKLIIDSLT